MMSDRSSWLCLLAGGLVSAVSQAQQVPLVYARENTGTDCAPPVLPEFDALPVVRPLTDPFAWPGGSGHSTDFDDWRCRGRG